MTTLHHSRNLCVKNTAAIIIITSKLPDAKLLANREFYQMFFSNTFQSNLLSSPFKENMAFPTAGIAEK